MSILPARCRGLISALALLVLAGPASAQSSADTRLLAEPAVSADHIAFAYDGDLWIADRDGTSARRLTTHPGQESRPRFSPDGNRLAFSGEYDGNTDVFVIPVSGGAPTRLTWHPGSDLVQDWSPNGQSVLFRSGRHTHAGQYLQLYTVGLDGGHPDQLPIPNAAEAAYSPDGTRLAYTPLPEAMHQWKNYRGGLASRIWLYDSDDHGVVEIPQPEGRSNDTDPMWIGNRVYFRSDRNGEFNLFSFDEASGSVEQLTDHVDFPVLNASAGSGVIVYEQGGRLAVYDPEAGSEATLRVAVAADLLETRPRWASGSQFLRGFDLSPSGARAVFEFRGDIVTVPADKGDPRALTVSSTSHERHPAWSPDGRSVAYFSDASGEYELHVAPQSGAPEVRTFKLEGSGYYDLPRWSPDGEHISYIDNSWSLYVLTLSTGSSTKIASEPLYGPIRTLHHAWSPDSKWIAYTLNTAASFRRVHLYSMSSGESRAITEGLSDVAEPVFDASGKYLYFFASTDAGPVRNGWFSQSNLDTALTGALYLAVLRAGEESPLKRESDEETADDEDADDESSGDEDPTVRVDFEGLSQRIVSLPVDPAWYSSLQPGDEGQLYYLRRDRAGLNQLFGAGAAPGQSLRRFSLSAREEETLLGNASAFKLSADRDRILVRSGQDWHIADAGEVDPSETRIATSDIDVRVEPPAEWRQMLREAWRIQRDYFYDPGMHGADWDAVWDKYEPFLNHLATRADLNRVIQWMLSELSVGHSYQGGGESLRDAENVPGGLLGADYDVDGDRYRFAKVYGGLNWNPSLRSPLTEPGVEVQEGEYLLAVRGVDLHAPENLYSRFENTAGKSVEITVGQSADGSGARRVTVVPVPSEQALRNREWVEGNIRRVHEATDGRIAYVWVPNTADAGHEYFKRYYYPQSHLRGVIVDERYNGGGLLADYVVDLLDRPYMSSWNTRYGQDLKTPSTAMQGPKVMLIDETAGSGGDYLPWMFRQKGLGPLIGRRTWGGLVGVLVFPTLMDGGAVTAPNIAFWTEEEGFGIENVGVPPDIEVDQMPVEVVAGRDPQLERAIEVILEELEANPPTEPERPPYPVRVRR